ncbi:hypothetical protein [Pollutimonas harenae]|uniref:FAD-binding protein n=1 Tax=Pollutimonas harenae TaxID=657015 RepID=A0A853GY44_9BURK|nr:hypothetical protein [Pollutimonas harenae]NYT87037.1 hypothetical protein [Pollutimonas harenae]TEA69254.1 hypothetical protein ERD84_15855 [Pollutimonas harenae]
MQSTSRRSFLTGRRTAQSPWKAFCQRLRNAIEGKFYEFDAHEAVGSARLVPKQASDVHKARALCAEYGVLMALDGVPHCSRLDEQHVLWVDPGREMSMCQRLEAGSTKWFVQPGCLLGELEAVGFSQFADLPCHITVAAWLADRRLCDWDTGATGQSGLVHASVLLADGTLASLGPFGAQNKKPLEGARLQKLVASLFQVAGSAEAQACRAERRWPARYRLDALLPAAGQTVNLAHLLLGHGGDLGWVEWLVLDELLVQPQAELPFGERYTPERAETAELAVQAGDLDMRVKQLFDEDERLPHPGQNL